MFSLLDIVLTAVNATVLGVPYASPKARQSARSAAEQQLRAYKAGAGEGAVALDGSRCEVLDTSDSFSTHNGKIRDYVLTLLLVTPENRYFLFKSNTLGKPYVQELSSERARLVLKDKFRQHAGPA